MTTRTSLPPTSTTVARPVLAVAALVVVWIAAVLAGLASHPAGAVVGIAGLGAVAYRFGPDAARWMAGRDMLRNPGAWGIVLLAASPFFPARLGPSYLGLSLDDLPLIAGTLLAAWEVVRSGGWRRLWHPVAAPLWLFSGWNGVSVLFAEPTVAELVKGVGRWALVALAFTVVARLAERPGYVRLAVTALVAVGFLQALFGLWAYTVDWMVESEIKARLIGMERFRWYQPLFERVPGRITGTLGVSSNFFGALMIIPAALAAAGLAAARDRAHRGAAFLVLAACFVALVLSYTRASIIGVLAGLVLLVAVTRRWIVVPAVVVLILLALTVSPIWSRFADEGNDRVTLAEKAVEVVEDAPVVGVGPGDFVEAQFDEEAPVLIATPHNSFLLAATETGIPGGVLFFLATLLPGLLVMRAAVFAGPNRILLAGIAAGMVGFATQTLSNNLFHVPTVAVAYWMVAAAGVAAASRREQPV